MTSQPNETSEEGRLDFKTRALAWSVRACATGVCDLLAWHPDQEALRKKIAAGESVGRGESLATILWEELIAAERSTVKPPVRTEDSPEASWAEPEMGTPGSYWLRRRRVGQWERWVAAAAKLPRTWVRLLEAPAPVVRAVQRELGVEMIAAAMSGESSRQVIKWLNPLGNDLALRVVERIREVSATAAGQAGDERPPARVATRWRDAYEKAAKMVNGERLASTLGRGLLATLFRQLPEAERREAARLSRSMLPPLLEHDEFLEPATVEEREWGGRLMTHRRIAGRIAGTIVDDPSEPSETQR